MTPFLQLASAMMEPIGVVGYLLCGLLLLRLWLALGAAAGWAVLMNVWDAAQEKARYAVSASELTIPRLAAALLVSAAVFYALAAWRERRAAAAEPRYAPAPSGALNPVPMVAEDEDRPVEPRA
jgi:hypothetical protein